MIRTSMLRTLSALSALVLLIGCGTAPVQSPSVHINQVGYYPEAPKFAAVVGAPGDDFFVVSVARGDTVLAGSLFAPQPWPHSNEMVRIADFSSLRNEGEYRILLTDDTPSHPFRIAPRVHAGVARAALKAFYFQRASTELPAAYAGPWARPAGHPDTSVLVHPSAATEARPAGTVLSAPYGWYDAGDYNKYVVNSGISTYQVLAIYEHFPEYARALDLSIPESGGALPDVLVEAMWNLRWMLAMQDPHDGGVYHKLTTANFEGAVMPHEATSQRYMVQKSTAATLNFAAVMAQASRIYGPYMPEVADSMRSAAMRAWEWAQANPAMYYVQDEMNERFEPAVVTGAYGDNDVRDEFAWAAMELYTTTGDEAFLAAGDHIDGWTVPGWSDVRSLGYYTLLHYRAHLGEVARIDRVQEEVLNMANALRASYANSPYRVAMGREAGDFVWGSNAVAANQSMALIQAYRLTGDATYLDAALSNLDYILGRNATGYSFVTGHGSRTPMHPHHRPSQADDLPEPVPGLLAGGPNPGQQDLAYCNDYPDGGYPSALPALSFIDHWCSYASNEIAINWNAPLAYVAAAIEALKSAGGASASSQ
jgi:endoglucanase